MKCTSLIAVFEGGTGMSAYILSVPSARCWFRWAVREAAARNDVTGWVRNLSDGRVELVAEGEHPELEAFQDAVPKAGLRWLVRSATEDWGKGTGEFRGFEITG